jgi:hypothetical protein
MITHRWQRLHGGTRRQGVRHDAHGSRPERHRAGTPDPKVLAIGLESPSSREGGLNRYFGQLLAALAELDMPVVGLVNGEARTSHESDFIEIAVPATPSLTSRLRAIASGVKRHSDADIVDAHFALTALPVLFGRLSRRPLVVHFQGPWADESALAGESRLACGFKRLLA